MRDRFLKMVLGVFMALSAAGAAAEDVGASGATHKEIESIGLTDETRFDKLSTLCMNGDGNLLACDLGKRVVKVIRPEGTLVTEWPLPVAPHWIHSSADGTVYIGGNGRLAKLDATGKVLKTVAAEEGNFPNAKVSGLATTEKDVFVSFGSGWSLRARATLVRFDRDFGGATVIAKGLRGCCQRLDLITKGEVLYVAENTRHRVVMYDRTGKVLGTWGQRDRKGLEGFGSCCNPMNLCFGTDGSLYTSESGLGRIKRYTPEGKFLELVGYVGVARFTRAGGLAASCANMAFAVGRDASRVYVLDVKKGIIRVLAKK